MNTNRNKLALRRQSIRTLTDSELRIAHGGGTGGAAPAPGTDRQTIGTSGTSVIRQSGTSVINPSGGSVQSSGTSVINPSGGRVAAH